MKFKKDMIQPKPHGKKLKTILKPNLKNQKKIYKLKYLKWLLPYML